MQKISILEKQNDLNEAIKLRVELAQTEKSISDISDRNRARVLELIGDEDAIDGGNQNKIWTIKKKLIPQNSVHPPTAKRDEYGVLISDKEAPEDLYVRTYKARLDPNPTPNELEELKHLKSSYLIYRSALLKLMCRKIGQLRNLKLPLKV